jgi:thioesterase domain-containing protein
MQDRGRRWQRIRQAIARAQFFRDLGAGEKPRIPSWAATPLARELITLAHRYQPTINRPVPIHLFRERGSFNHESHPASFNRTDHLEDGGWGRWAGAPPEIHWLDGDHFTALKRPQVAQTAIQLRTSLDKHFTAISHNGQFTRSNLGKEV